MVHLQDLPVELLKHILSFIADREDEPLRDIPDKANRSAKAKGDNANEPARANEYDDDDTDEDEDLRNICLVSRLFRDLAQPLLFRYFDDASLTDDFGKIFSFAKAIYRRPELGQHVHGLSLQFSPFTPGPRGGLATEDSDVFKAAIRELQLGDQEKTWIAAMENFDFSVFAALLANKTPNLRWLDLPGGEHSMKPFSQLLSRNSSFLSSLEFLKIECDNEFSGYNIASYEELVTLPNLVSVEFESGDLVDSSFPSTWTPETLSVKHVAFHHCHVDAGAIQKLMQACKKLDSFSYDSFSLDPRDRRFRMPGTAPELNASQALEAALLHKATLERFHLEFARDPWGIEDLEQYLSSRVKIGSFRDFSVLEFIIIPHALLPPHPQFLRSLKTLVVTDCNSSIHDLVQKISKTPRTVFTQSLPISRYSQLISPIPSNFLGSGFHKGRHPNNVFSVSKVYSTAPKWISKSFPTKFLTLLTHMGTLT